MNYANSIKVLKIKIIKKKYFKFMEEDYILAQVRYFFMTKNKNIKSK